MAEELSLASVLRFLQERGGRVRNQELLEHFRGCLQPGPEDQRARARQRFKDIVNELGSVRPEPGGGKSVCLKRRYRLQRPGDEGATQLGHLEKEQPSSGEPKHACQDPRQEEVAVQPGQQEQEHTGKEHQQRDSREEAVQPWQDLREVVQPRQEPKEAVQPWQDLREAVQHWKDPGEAVQPWQEPGKTVQPWQDLREAVQPWQEPGETVQPWQDLREAVHPSQELGKAVQPGQEEPPDSGRLQDLPSPPRISVTHAAPAGADPAAELPEPESSSSGHKPGCDAEGLRSPRCSPGRSSRETFRELLLSGASPQLRRGGFFAGSGRRAGGSSEADSASLASEESLSSAALEPREHAWMLRAAAGGCPWESLRPLLSAEPTLLGKRDFITGLSCLHWAAKHGRPELLAALLGWARQAALPVDINARASGGYTALHLAAMHGRAEVAKLLIGAYDADVDIRDYSGRKAHHYLPPDTSADLRALVRGEPLEEEEGGPLPPGRWSLARVLPANLIVHKLSQVMEEERSELWGSPRGKEVRRSGSSSSSRAKPRLNKVRFRTQIIHTTPSSKEPEDEPLKSPLKLRPKSNMFG